VSESLGSVLNEALAQYRAKDPEDTYDEVLRAVSRRAAEEESLGKADIGSLVLWKRITAQAPWARDLGKTPDETVRMATHKAWKAANDATLTIPEAGQNARDELFTVHGLGGTAALASAVLLACAPARMAVWDRRVGQSLDDLGFSRPRRTGFYGNYLSRLLDLAVLMGHEAPSKDVTPRLVDLALYEIADSPDLRERAAAIRASG
jgi:hypothetical protein